MSTVTAVRSGDRFYLGFTVDLDLRMRLQLSQTAVMLSERHAWKVAELAKCDDQLSAVIVKEGAQW